MKTNKTKGGKEKYTIKLNKDQLKTMQRALEYYSRHLSGQFDYLDPFESILIKKEGMSVFGNDETKRACNILKKEIFDLDPSSSFGIGGSCLEAQISYEMYREIYRQELKEDPIPHSVYNSETLQYSELPLIKITKDVNN